MVVDCESQLNLAKPKRKLAEKFAGWMSCFACRTRKNILSERDILREVGIQNEGENTDDVPDLESDISDDECDEPKQEKSRPVSSTSGSAGSGNRISTLSSDSSHSLRMVDTYIRTDGMFHLMGMTVRGGIPGPNRTSVGSNSSLNIRIHKVHPGSFAHGFGLKENDIICTVNNTKVEDLQSVLNELISKDSSKLQVEIKREVHLPHSGVFETKTVTAVLKHQTSLVIEQAEEGTGILSSEDIPTDQIEEAEDDTKLLVRLCSVPIYLKFHKKCVYIDEEKRQFLLDGSKKKEKSLFVIHYYTDIKHEENSVPVLLQNVNTKLCLAMINDNIVMRDAPVDLHVIHSDNPSVLKQHNVEVTEDANNSQFSTFESALPEHKGCYVGFKSGTKLATSIKECLHDSFQVEETTDDNVHKIESLSSKEEFLSLVTFQMFEAES